MGQSALEGIRTMATKISIDKIAVPADIKLVNRQRILETFMSGEKQTIAAIHAATGISKPTTMRALQYFCQRGILKSAGYAGYNVNGGRRSEYFEFADERKILTIAMWPDAITLALADLVGTEVYAVTRQEHRLDHDPETAFAFLAECVHEYLDDHSMTAKQLYGVALSVSGIVDDTSGLLRYDSQNPEWGNDVSLTAHLQNVFKEPLVFLVDNAGKACGRAVLLDEEELSRCRLLTLFTTWGVCSCMMERGHVLNGRDALIGEIGHMQIADCPEKLCGCGKRHCLESAVRLDHLHQLLMAEKASWLEQEPLTFQSLFIHSRQGDPAARKIVEYLARCYASALHNLSLCYNQEAVVFQGDMAWADPYFDQCLKRKLDEFRYYPEGEWLTTRYDRRELSTLAARGDAALLRKKYFAAMSYEDD